MAKRKPKSKRSAAVTIKRVRTASAKKSKPAKKTEAAKKSSKPAKKSSKSATKSSKKTTKSAASKPAAKRPATKATPKSIGGFVSIYIWLVLVDAILSGVMLLAQNVFTPSSAVTAIRILVGIYGIAVFILSIIAFFVLLLRGVPKLMLWLPVYVVLAPVLLFLAGLLLGGLGDTTLLMVMSWIAVGIEFILAAFMLNQYA